MPSGVLVIQNPSWIPQRNSRDGGTGMFAGALVHPRVVVNATHTGSWLDATYVLDNKDHVVKAELFIPGTDISLQAINPPSDVVPAEIAQIDLSARDIPVDFTIADVGHPARSGIIPFAFTSSLGPAAAITRDVSLPDDFWVLPFPGCSGHPVWERESRRLVGLLSTAQSATLLAASHLFSFIDALLGNPIGDYNHDGIISRADFDTWFSLIGSPKYPGGPPWDAKDFDTLFLALKGKS